MWRFMLITFAVLGFAFWELSGGADYKPGVGSRQYAAAMDARDAAQSEALAAAQAERARPAAAGMSDSERTIATIQPATAKITVDGAQVTLASAGAAAPATDRAKRLHLTLGGEAATRPSVATVKADPDKIARLVAAARVGRENPAAVVVETAAAVQDDGRDMRKVRSERVNLRAGPGTDFAVAGKLTRGARVEVLEDTGDGWVRLEVEETGEIAWMADFLLAPAN